MRFNMSAIKRNAMKRNAKKISRLALYAEPSKNDGKLRFSGHQTFVARNGWLEKGVNLILSNPHGFLDDDAVVQLGVGKNMVESIKYWCQQTGLIEDADVASTMRLTDLGRFLFGDGNGQGVDPYLEDDASLWLLHYKMVVDAPESTWSIVFNHYNKPEFRKDEMTPFIKRRLSDKGQSVSDKTLERDVDCFIRTYAGTRSAGGEESFDSPFLALRLIQSTSDTGLYRLNIGKKHNLPDALIGYAILRYMESIGDLNVSLVRLLFDPKSPGQVFKLNQGALVDAVLALGNDRSSRLTYSDTAGLATVQYSGDRFKLANDIKMFLNRYYGRRA